MLESRVGYMVNILLASRIPILPINISTWISWFSPIAKVNIVPIGSMYGIYANIRGILMVNVSIYSIHGSYGVYKNIFLKFPKQSPVVTIYNQPLRGLDGRLLEDRFPSDRRRRQAQATEGPNKTRQLLAPWQGGNADKSVGKCQKTVGRLWKIHRTCGSLLWNMF